MHSSHAQGSLLRNQARQCPGSGRTRDADEATAGNVSWLLLFRGRRGQWLLKTSTWGLWIEQWVCRLWMISGLGVTWVWLLVYAREEEEEEEAQQVPDVAEGAQRVAAALVDSGGRQFLLELGLRRAGGSYQKCASAVELLGG